ncbi:hypothetical protein [Streptosporangium sp. CA-115845]|uniref:hypothetical protein n=1 Tax=Streptosporangium sp. CA-115845 TaxID=3240071 RepID=UPI003D8D5713
MTDRPPLQPFICGGGAQAEVAPARVGVVILAWICPSCDGAGLWDDRLPCEMCSGRGAVDDDTLGEWDRAEVRPAPIPPAVMRKPCADCAYRPGAPEADELPPTDAPFFCHHGMPVVNGAYAPTAWADGRPLGAMVCRGWWEATTRQHLHDVLKAYQAARDGWGNGA